MRPSYLDTGADTPAGYLVGCVEYHYKVVTVTCDPAQLTNYTNPGAGTTTTYTAAQFATVSGTPTDGTRTSSPTLTSKAGYRRIILSLTNPSRAAGQHPDFMFTRVYFSTGGFPQLTETRDAEGYNVVTDPGGGPARLIPDGGGIVATGGGPTTINFDDEDAEVPNGSTGRDRQPAAQQGRDLLLPRRGLRPLQEPQRGHRAGAFDRRAVQRLPRGRALPGRSAARRGPARHRGVRGRAAAPRLELRRRQLPTHPDFQGFRVVRCQGSGCTPLDPIQGGVGTVLGGTYLSPDTHLLDDSVVDGQVYNYRVYAGRLLLPALARGRVPSTQATTRATTPRPRTSRGSRSASSTAPVSSATPTTLTAASTAVENTIPVASTVGWAHRRLLINSEIIECNGVAPTAFTDCWWRGAEGTVAIAHLAGTPVRSYPPAPARAAVTGDLSLVPPTFLHNFVQVGARNTSAGSLALNEVEAAWVDPAAWFTRLLYNDSELAFDDALPFEHSSTGSNVPLSPAVTVDAMLDNIPLKLTFLKADGTADSSLDLREEPIDLIWRYRNNATGIDTCSRPWETPGPGDPAPAGPAVLGTTQSLPTWGTVAWPVPGLQNNPPDAIIAPANSWNFVMTNVHDTSGTGIASVRLYYATTDASVDVAPAVAGAYPGCDPYTMVELSNWVGTETWSGSYPAWPAQPSAFNGRNVWYYLVAVDNEGNFDREPEVDQGAFQYYQQPEDPCLNTPRAPEMVGTADASSVTLDWSGSWWGPPPTYYNTDWSICNDLGGFRVYHQIGQGVRGTRSPARRSRRPRTPTRGTSRRRSRR